MGLIFQSKLTRYNLESKPIGFDSREYGYLVLTLEYFDVEFVPNSTTEEPQIESTVDGIKLIEEEIKLKSAIPPIKIRFVPDPKLSVNQIMEFKKLHTDMRMVLSRCQADGGLSLIYRDNKLYLKICHYTSEMEISIKPDNFSQIQEILDQICVVISTNTFFKLDLKELKKTGRKTYHEVSNYLWSYFR